MCHSVTVSAQDLSDGLNIAFIVYCLVQNDGKWENNLYIQLLKTKYEINLLFEENVRFNNNKPVIIYH